MDAASRHERRKYVMYLVEHFHSKYSNNFLDKYNDGLRRLGYSAGGGYDSLLIVSVLILALIQSLCTVHAFA